MVSKTSHKPSPRPGVKLGAVKKKSSAASKKPKLKEVKAMIKESNHEAIRFTLKRIGERKIKVLVTENPQRANSNAAKVFDLYKTGDTVREFLEKGGTLGYLKHNVRYGHVELVDNHAAAE
jgi:hypothetical protein